MTSWLSSPRAWGLLARMVVWRTALPILTRVLPLERIVRMLARPGGRHRPAEQELVLRAAHRLWRSGDAPCLQRSLALFHELGRLGADPRFVCGISREGGEIIGHAWVESAGVAVLDDPRIAEEFEELVAYSPCGLRED